MHVLPKTQVKLFPNFTSIHVPFDYLLISRVTNYSLIFKPGCHFGTAGKVAMATL